MFEFGRLANYGPRN